MNHDDKPTDEQLRTLLFVLGYYGPWERLEGFFLGVRPNGPLRWDIRDDGTDSRLLILLGHLGSWANQRDIAWRKRHLARGTSPWPLWRRR